MGGPDASLSGRGCLVLAILGQADVKVLVLPVFETANLPSGMVFG
jgi:hypothetical protein